uniref:thiopurine S-methyltransferase n=1 Tax=Cyprinus carpio TaxID=7962 RepID=A0A8C2IRQ5_CYPCA
KKRREEKRREEKRREMSAQEDRVMALSEWEDRWQEGRTGFHRSEVHNLLKNNLEKVLCGRKEVRFFFPLCGKAVDMKWLADMGHTVVGVEISEKGIKQFFAEQNLAFDEEPVPAIPGAKVFKSADGKISIYQCDLYKFSSAVGGKFGGIWDRGAQVAINPCDRQKYATLLVSLMNYDCRYLVDTLEYNPELYKGPPFLVSEEDVKKMFGGGCDIELLESVDAFEEKHKSWGLDSLTEKVYLLTPKAQ